jgi:hypothetical protein
MLYFLSLIFSWFVNPLLQIKTNASLYSIYSMYICIFETMFNILADIALFQRVAHITELDLNGCTNLTGEDPIIHFTHIYILMLLIHTYTHTFIKIDK